jgi:mono/diheme cytochrome c family protein
VRGATSARAIEAGEEIYRRRCQACHLNAGTGRFSPSLVGGNARRARTGTLGASS